MASPRGETQAPMMLASLDTISHYFYRTWLHCADSATIKAGAQAALRLAKERLGDPRKPLEIRSLRLQSVHANP